MRHPPFTLAAALAALAVAFACLADPEARGGLLPTQAEGPETDTVPGGPVPDHLAHHGEGHCDLICPPIVVVGEKPCKDYGSTFDPQSGECRCFAGFDEQEDGSCKYRGFVPPKGGPAGSIDTGGNGSKKNPTDNDPDSTKLTVKLRCTPADRGGRISCRVKPSNAQGEMEYSWRFQPKPSRVRIRKGMEGPELPNVRLSYTDDDEWSGTAAAGGRVSVVATDDKRFAHTHVSFVVDGYGSTPVSLDRGTDLTDRLWPGVILGLNVNSAYNPTVGQVMEGSGSVVPVEDGPNKGYFIVESGYHVSRYWRMNERLFATGPKEIPDGDSLVRHWDYLKALGYEPRDLYLGTFRHERYGGFIPGKKGHQGQIEKAVTVEACGDVGAIVANIVAPSENMAEGLMDRTKETADTAFIMAILHDKVYGHHNNSPIAYWKPKKSPYTSFHNDPRNPKHARNYTSPGCDWMSF